jgi:hypothetical protein
LIGVVLAVFAGAGVVDGVAADVVEEAVAEVSEGDVPVVLDSAVAAGLDVPAPAGGVAFVLGDSPVGDVVDASAGVVAPLAADVAAVDGVAVAVVVDSFSGVAVFVAGVDEEEAGADGVVPAGLVSLLVDAVPQMSSFETLSADEGVAVPAAGAAVAGDVVAVDAGDVAVFDPPFASCSRSSLSWR